MSDWGEQAAYGDEHVVQRGERRTVVRPLHVVKTLAVEPYVPVRQIVVHELDEALTELDEAGWFPHDALPADLGRYVRPILKRVRVRA